MRLSHTPKVAIPEEQNTDSHIHSAFNTQIPDTFCNNGGLLPVDEQAHEVSGKEEDENGDEGTENSRGGEGYFRAGANACFLLGSIVLGNEERIGVAKFLGRHIGHGIDFHSGGKGRHNRGAEAVHKALDHTSGEGTEKKYGAHFHTWQALVQNWGVQDGKNTIMATDYSFFKPYYEMILGMQNDGICMDFGTLKSAGIHYSAAFADGSVAMMPMGTWYAATIVDSINKGESDVNWGIATIPHPESMPAGSSVGSTTPLCVNESSANKDLAWEFVKFACSEEGAMAVANTGAFPARLDESVLEVICSVPGMPENAKEALAVSGIVLDRPIAAHVSEVDKMLGEEHSLIMLGEMGIDEVLAEMGELSAEIQAG